MGKIESASTLGDRDFTLAREQLDRAHLAQIQAHGVVSALGRFCLLDLGRRCALHIDEFAALALLLGLLARLGLLLRLNFLGFDTRGFSSLAPLPCPPVVLPWSCLS